MTKTKTNGTTDSKRARAECRLRRCAPTLNELSHVWKVSRPQRLWWDRKRRVHAARGHRVTYRALFGRWAPLRGSTLRMRVETLRGLLSPNRWKGPIETEVSLPHDGVVVPIKKGVVVLSGDTGQVLKVMFGRFTSLQREIEAFPIIREAGIEAFAPTLIDHGDAQEDHRWMLSTLSPNTDPIKYPLVLFVDIGARWRRLLRYEILPVLEQFYEAAGVDVVHVDDVLGQMEDKLQELDAAEPLWRLWRHAKRVCPTTGNAKAVRTTIHNDLQPAHIHCTKQRFEIIDWACRYRDVCREIFWPHMWRAGKGKYKKDQAFWAWLRGDIAFSELPDNARSDIELFVDWERSWRNVESSSALLRFRLLICVLSRAMKVFEECDIHSEWKIDGTKTLETETFKGSLGLMFTGYQLSALDVIDANWLPDSFQCDYFGRRSRRRPL